MSTIRPILNERWLVQRGGGPGSYAPGWFALDPDLDRSAWFPTHAQAMEFANYMVLTDRITRYLARWGITYRPKAVRELAP